MLWITTNFTFVFQSASGPKLGHDLSNCQSIVSYCQTMCFKPNLKVLVIVKCSYFYFHFVHCCENGVTNIEALNQPLICDDFDSKLQEFK
jgi:hypothetical protein